MASPALLNLAGTAGTLLNALFPPSEKTTTSGSSNIQTLLNTLSQLFASQQQQTQQTVSPEIQALINKTAGVYSNQLQGATNLQPYIAQQRENINNQADLSSRAVDNIMASRGLSTSPVAATSQVGVNNARFGALTNLNQSIPLLQQQLLQPLLQGSQGLIATAPRGTTGFGTSSQQGFTNQSGSTIGQYNQNTNQVANPGGLSGLLASLFP